MEKGKVEKIVAEFFAVGEWQLIGGPLRLELMI